jgi:phospholipase C
VFIAGGGQAPLRCERHLWRFSQFSADAAANALPQFSFVVHHILHGAHSGTPRPADAGSPRMVEFFAQQ